MAIQMGKALAFTAVGGLFAGLVGCGGGTPEPAAGGTTDPAAGGATTPPAGDATTTTAAKGCCKGTNECKGKGGCKTDANDCKGKNECKGKGGCKTDACAGGGEPAPAPAAQ
jgi:hypothetical protein